MGKGVAMSLIEVKDIKKVYRLGNEKVHALRGVSFNIEAGEVCVILGKSGSGKSTLLNMMAGLEKPTKGSVKIKGEAVTKMSEKRLAIFRQKNVGFIFQSYNLMGALTALENVAMPLTFRGIGSKRRNAAAKKMLENVGLGDRVKHKPNQMSGGQQQRVGIARALVGKAEVVFADEPTGNLDSKTSAEVMKLMVDICKHNNQALVIVTHDGSVGQYADKIVSILDGEVQNIVVKGEKKHEQA